MNFQNNGKNRPKGKNWLKTGYAAVINMVFVSMVEFYGGLPRYKSKWSGRQYESLIRGFTQDLAVAILDPQQD